MNLTSFVGTAFELAGKFPNRVFYSPPNLLFLILPRRGHRLIVIAVMTITSAGSGMFFSLKTMANTYSQIYIHLVFAVKGRQSLIRAEWKETLYKYITGIISNQKGKLIVINGVEDHIHILIGIKPDYCISNMVRDIKTNSSKFIKEQGFLKGRFEWQEGFGAFSVSQSQVPKLIAYIQNQEEHHQKRTFIAEYTDFLNGYEIDFKPEYLFEPVARTSIGG